MKLTPCAGFTIIQVTSTSMCISKLIRVPPYVIFPDSIEMLFAATCKTLTDYKVLFDPSCVFCQDVGI